MRSLKSLKRLAVGAVITGAALSAVPAAANAASAGGAGVGGMAKPFGVTGLSTATGSSSMACFA